MVSNADYVRVDESNGEVMISFWSGKKDDSECEGVVWLKSKVAGDLAVMIEQILQDMKGESNGQDDV